MKNIQTIALIILSLSSTIPLVQAGTVVPQSSIAPMIAAHSPFEKGGIEFQALTGAFFSLDSSDRPTLNHSLSSWRLGLMLNNPRGNGMFRGNYELLIEGFFGRVFEGPGEYLGGGTIQLRYNFVQIDSKWVPYVQIGAGAFYSDIANDQTQSLIGSDWEYNLQAAIGIRRMISHKWAFSVEGGFRHVSNRDSADRTTGLDLLGVQVGLSRFF